jgi:tetratricopeptide (TPR) repeat protein
LANQALRDSPNDCALLSLKAIALSRLDQTKTSLATYDQAIALCPRYLAALEGAAEIEYQLGTPTVEAHLKQVIAIVPENLTARAMLASFYMERGDCAHALPEFKASSALFAQRPELMRGYGSCLVETGQYQDGLDIYLKLRQTDQSPAIEYDVALLEWKTHAYDDALNTLQPLMSGNDPQALALASHIYEEQGDTPKSVASLRSAIVLTPKVEGYYLDFANIAFAHRSFQVGIDMLNNGIAQIPNSAPLFLARGALQMQLGNGDLALADFERAHQLGPKLSYVTDALGMLHTQQHEGAQALDFFRNAVHQHPEDAFLQYLLAEQLSANSADTATKNQQEAITAAKISVHLDPTYTPAHDLLALLYLRSGKLEPCIKEAEIALAQDPTDESALYQEMMALKRVGETAKANALVARLQSIRQLNAQKRQATDRYRLLDDSDH